MTAQTRLEPRDQEILRALLRVRYLTTRQVAGAFFSCPRVGRRRIHRLSEYDLIRPHAKGLPEFLKYTAWRLTPRGLDAVAHAFPEEPVPDGLIDRVTSGSLHHALHREALANLYLALIVPHRSGLSESNLAGHRRWVAEMRARADAITWQPDGDVVHSASDLGERMDVVPDAVARAPRQGRRIFIELDRSTKDLGRIRQGLVRYAAVLRHADLDGDVAYVLFVVRSAARKKNIQDLAGHLPVIVLRDVEAVEWLQEDLLALAPVARDPKLATTLPAVARRVYGWTTRLQRVLHASGILRALEQAELALVQEGHEQLVALYRALKDLEEKGAGA